MGFTLNLRCPTTASVEIDQELTCKSMSSNPEGPGLLVVCYLSKSGRDYQARHFSLEGIRMRYDWSNRSCSQKHVNTCLTLREKTSCSNLEEPSGMHQRHMKRMC